jgi:ABC-2 type transport system permease protein
VSLSQGVHIEQKLWQIIWKLLRLRLIIFTSGFKRARLRRKIGTIVVMSLFLAFLGFIFFLSFVLLRFLRSPELAQYTGGLTGLLDSVPVVIFSGAFIGILMTSFGVLLQALYLAGDMDFLLSAPVPIRAVFLTKLLQAILPNFGLICLFALPVLIGLGASYQYNLLYYPLVLIVLVALALAAAGISSLLVMLVVRIFPARRVAEILAFVGAIFSFLCSQSGQLANMGDLSSQQASQAISLASRLNTPWSPLAWAGRGVAAIGQNEWISGIGLTLLTLVLSGLIFGAALTISEKLYYSGWASMQTKGHKAKAPSKKRAGPSSYSKTILDRLLPKNVGAVFVKDLLVLRRDLRNMSQLVMPLIIGIIYAFMFMRNGELNSIAGSSDLPTWATNVLKNANLYFNVGLSLFVGWLLLARLAMMGFSQEGRSYWLIKTAPISVPHLIGAKFLVAYLPTLGLSWAFLLVISLVERASLSTLIFTLPVVALCIAGNAGINLFFGITGAKFDWEDPRHMQTGGSGCLASLVSIIYLPIDLVLFFCPPILFTAFGLPEIAGQVIGLVLGGTFSLIFAFGPPWLVRGKVPLLAEG